MSALKGRGWTDAERLTVMPHGTDTDDRSSTTQPTLQLRASSMDHGILLFICIQNLKKIAKSSVFPNTTMLEASAATVVAKLASGKARASARSECAATAGPSEDDTTATAGGTYGYSRTSSSATVDIKICRQQRQFTNDAEVAESAGIPSSDTPLLNEIPGRTLSSSVGADMGAGDEAVIATAPHISPPSPKLIIRNANQPRPRPSSTPTPTLPCPPPNEHAPNSPTVAPVATGTVGAAAPAMARSKPALVEGKIYSLIRK